MDKKIVDQIISGLAGLFAKKAVPAPVPAPSQPVPAPVQIPIVVQNAPKIEIPTIIVVQGPINWSDPKAKIAAKFSVSEALTLQSWGVMHVPSEAEQAAIVGIAQKVSQAAGILEQIIGRKVSISVHAFMRPEKANVPGSQWDGKDYNRYIYETQVWKNLTAEEKAKKTVPKSPHRTGHAIDFHIVGFEGKEKCAQIRAMLLPHLEALGLRMEDMDGGWIHLDDLAVVNKRFFKP